MFEPMGVAMRSMDSIYDAIAKQHGVSAESVRRDIRHAINKGMENPDESTQAVWSEVESIGKRPSPKEVVCFCALRVLEKLSAGITS